MTEATPQKLAGAGAPRLKLSLAASACWALAMLGLYAQPQLLESIMAAHGASESTVGRMFSFENGSFFITLLLASGPIASMSRARTAACGILFLALGNVASAYAGGFDALLVGRTITGVGAGLVSAAGTAAIASSLQPDRIFAIVTLLHTAVLSAEFKAIPYVTTEADPSGCYLLMAAVAVASLPFCGWLLSPGKTDAKKGKLITLLLSAPNRTLAIAVMVGMFVFEVGQSGVFTFIDQIGIQAGLDADERGSVLGATSFMGMSGALLAAWLGTRFGRVWPVTIGLGINIAAVAGLAVCESNFAYGALNLLWSVGYNFLVPYLLGALATLDNRGRWAVAGESLWNGGAVPGPWIAALLVQESGMLSLAVWSLVTGGICLVLITGALRRFESGQAGTTST